MLMALRSPIRDLQVALGCPTVALWFGIGSPPLSSFRTKPPPCIPHEELSVGAALSPLLSELRVAGGS